jgi:hypothetical protein
MQNSSMVEQEEAENTGQAGTMPAARRQISLRGLFACMTYFGFASALAEKFGLGLFVLLIGSYLRWLC